MMTIIVLQPQACLVLQRSQQHWVLNGAHSYTWEGQKLLHKHATSWQLSGHRHANPLTSTLAWSFD